MGFGTLFGTGFGTAAGRSEGQTFRLQPESSEVDRRCLILDRFLKLTTIRGGFFSVVREEQSLDSRHECFVGMYGNSVFFELTATFLSKKEIARARGKWRRVHQCRACYERSRFLAWECSVLDANSVEIRTCDFHIFHSFHFLARILDTILDIAVIAERRWSM
jgi:hypothetical protein